MNAPWTSQAPTVPHPSTTSSVPSPSTTLRQIAFQQCSRIQKVFTIFYSFIFLYFDFYLFVHLYSLLCLLVTSISLTLLFLLLFFYSFYRLSVRWRQEMCCLYGLQGRCQFGISDALPRHRQAQTDSLQLLLLGI